MKSFGLNRQFNYISSDPMILEIDTSKSVGLQYDLFFYTGVTPSTQRTNVIIDWGDGVVEAYTSATSGDKSHTYSVAGTYTIKIYGQCAGIGRTNTTTNTNYNKLTKIISWGCLKGMHICSLGNQARLTSLPTYLPSHIKNLIYFFHNSPYNGTELLSWDTSNVTFMGGMFQSATAFNQNIGSWNMSAVTGTNIMFFGATAFNQNIGSWDMSKVNNMSNMFAGATAFNQNISSWNTGAVTTMANMFQNAKAFNQPIGSWNTANVTSMANMFQVTTAGNSAFNQDIGTWNVSKVTTFANMFQGTATGKTVFNNGGSDSIKNWSINTTAGVNVSMNQMFMHNNAFNQPIGSWNTSRVQNLGAMFSSGVFNQNIGGWNTSNCTSLDAMFNGNTVYNNGGVDSITWDTSLVGSFGFMFNGAAAFNQPISGFKFNSATILSSMLNSCGMSNDNYSKTLIGWANTISSTGLGKSKSLAATGRRYNSTTFSGSPYNTGSGARAYLVLATGSGGAGWTISDSGAGV